MEKLLTVLKCKQLGIALKTNVNIHGQALWLGWFIFQISQVHWTGRIPKNI
jgi:hypothetical protein